MTRERKAAERQGTERQGREAGGGGVEGAVEALARRLEELGGGFLLVVTGAGVSAPSGLATFRGEDPGAVWRQDDVALGTEAFFRRDPVTHWRWYLERFSGILDARPNPAHRALVDLERWHAGRGGDFLLVTQNIDTLHEDAGSERLVKVHGTADRFRCSSRTCVLGAPEGSIPRDRVDLAGFVAEPSRQTLPTCPRCGSLLRAHALFFDEYYQDHLDYRFDDVRRAAVSADLLLTVGTSHAVGVTEIVLGAAVQRGVPALSLDPSGVAPHPDVTPLAARAEEVLPRVVDRVADRRPSG